jgi:mRNA interferase RelE/StbE
MYKVEFVSSVAKEFRSLDATIKRRIIRVIDNLLENPRSEGVPKLHEHKDLYRIRVGSNRAVYKIDDETRLIRVTRIRHRREIYR